MPIVLALLALLLVCAQLPLLSNAAFDNCSSAWPNFYEIGPSETCVLSGTYELDEIIAEGTIFVDTSGADFVVGRSGNMTVSSNGSIISLQSDIYAKLNSVNDLQSLLESAREAETQCTADLRQCTGEVPPEEIPLGSLPDNSSLVTYCELYEADTARKVFNFSYDPLLGLQEAGGLSGVPDTYHVSIPEDS